jgi:hypothetical protein
MESNINSEVEVNRSQQLLSNTLMQPNAGRTIHTLKLAGLAIMAFFFLSSFIVFMLFQQIFNNGSVEKETVVPTKDSELIGFPYSVVDTAQIKCFDDSSEIACGNELYPSQDADLESIPLSYTNNGNGTISDNNTGLMWQSSSDLNSDGIINADDKKEYSQALTYCNDLQLAGYTDWRLPDIKTLYSLMNFRGTDTIGTSDSKAAPFISTEFFDFGYGDISAGDRQIDAQWASSTLYVSKVMNGASAMFGLNLADGRIKGYPATGKGFYLKCVRGNNNYGQNELVDNGDGTIKDLATGLMWQKNDSIETFTWSEALQACDQADTAGFSDWRLPNAKELHSIVEYKRSPDTSDSAALDPNFESTSFINEADQKDWGFYWSSTTHERSDGNGSDAVYISFGRALGYMSDPKGVGSWQDVHGAGAQRSDPKTPLDINNLSGNSQFQVIDGAISHGPQGDVVRGRNFYRCVRGSSATYNGEVPQKSDSSTSFNNSNTIVPTQQDRNPPQEAITTCMGKNENSQCSFDLPDKTINGQCLLVQEQLICVPN